MKHPDLSPELLEELKKQLEEKKAELEEQLQVLSQEDSYDEIDRTVGNSEDVAEAEEDQSHLLNDLQEDTVEESLARVDKALAKMETGEYGICETHNEPISIERLKVYPEAEDCLEDAEAEETEKDSE